MTPSQPDRHWLPDAVCTVRVIDQAALEIHEAEARLVAQAAPRRREHFAAGRICAREAMQLLGHPVDRLLRADSGAPAWPPGYVGSIAHCEGRALAIVAKASSPWQAVGVDVEPDRPLPADVAGYALTAAERERFARQPGGLDTLGLLAFSAKECVHKCVHPLRAAFLEFDEVEIDIAGDGFNVLPLSMTARSAFDGLRGEGRWLRADGFVWTALALA